MTNTTTSGRGQRDVLAGRYADPRDTATAERDRFAGRGTRSRRRTAPAVRLDQRRALRAGERRLTVIEGGKVLVELGREGQSGKVYTKPFQLDPDEEYWLLCQLLTRRMSFVSELRRMQARALTGSA
jgi:hypothetical protein